MDLELYPSAQFGYDLAIDDNGLMVGESLETAVIISLFSDRLAAADDLLPDGSDDRRGWWGDAFAPVDGHLIGSRLWLLGREKQLTRVLKRAEEYAGEALQWLIADGIVTRVAVTASVAPGNLLALQIELDAQANWQDLRAPLQGAGIAGTLTYGYLLDGDGQQVLDGDGNPLW